MHILASTSVLFTITTVQVPNLALTHTKRITVSGGRGEALIVTDPGIIERSVGGGVPRPPPHPLADSVTIYAKTTMHCSPDFSMHQSNCVFSAHSVRALYTLQDQGKFLDLN
jgi:hypothetical protein